MRVVTYEWKIKREREWRGNVATFHSFKIILVIDIVLRLKQMTKKFYWLNQNYLFTMDALIGIYGVVHTFDTKIIIKKKLGCMAKS